MILIRAAEAGDLPIRNMASELTIVPEEQSIATYPVPRTDWVKQVDNNIKESRKMVAPIEVVLDGDSITWLFQKRKF